MQHVTAPVSLLFGYAGLAAMATAAPGLEAPMNFAADAALGFATGVLVLLMAFWTRFDPVSREDEAAAEGVPD